MTISGWTVEAVAERLEEAARTMRRMPTPMPRGVRAAWPDIVWDAREAYGYTPPALSMGPLSAAAIRRMDECQGWLRWMDQGQMRLVWAKANGVPWRVLAKRLHTSQRTTRRKWLVAARLVVDRLGDTALDMPDI